MSPRGRGKLACPDASVLVRGTADGVCADRCCIRAERRRKGLTPVPAPALRDFQSLCSRARFPRGADAPRSCIAARTLVGEKTIFGMHKRTSGSGAAGVSPPWLGKRACNTDTAQVRGHSSSAETRAAGMSPPWLGHTIGVPREASVVQRRAITQPREALVRPPWICEYRTCNAASTKSRQTAEGVCADRRCIRVERLRKGLTPVPAPALRDFQSLCSRARFPRGADAPRSCVGVRTSAGEKTIFAMHERTLAQERRA